MSYSRWSDSTWYTYWNTCSGPDLNSQVFTVCGDGSFTYQDLKADIDACLNKIEGEFTQAEKDELKGYMMEFIEHMEREFEVKDDK